MNLKPIKANMTELDYKTKAVLFSYETPVVFIDDEKGAIYVTSKFWSRTTSRHINKYLSTLNTIQYAVSRVDQDRINDLVREVK